MRAFSLKGTTNKFLDDKRQQTDPLADRLIERIAISGYHAKFSPKLKELIRNDSYSPSLFDDLPDELCTAIDDYFQNSSQLPSWFDSKLIQLGQDVFSRYVPLIMMILQYQSLPLCYSCKNGAKILHLTGRLTSRYGNKKVFGRLVETAQMVINTMSPESFSAEGKGIITMQKVRLIHALVRFFVKSPHHNQHGWDIEEMGEPINQEDLAGTLMSFGAVIINGLERLQIKLSVEEKLGYMHCWKVIGYLTGLDDDLLPNTYEEGWELAVRILRHQAAPSEEGVELTQSCIELPKKLSLGIFQNDISEFMVRYMLKDTSEAIGIDIGDIVGAGKSRQNYKSLVLLFAKLAAIESLNRTFLKGYHKFNDLSWKLNFSIPNSL